MERKGSAWGRVHNLRAVTCKDGMDRTTEVAQEVTGIALGSRMVYCEQAEVWTVRGILRDGSTAKQDIGELSFVLIPGDMEPATAVTGFIAPSAPYALAVSEEGLWQQLRGMVTQLGYDLDGFYVSIGVGGRARYYEDGARKGR